ncbi:RNA-binding S4 domain-containing protein [Glycocaulis profundi]|nr:RNA-binding S4 domain-containing protein [Glycocaulis profundi]
MIAPEAGRQRAEVWLFRARIFKSRGLAAKAVEAGHVRIERPGSDPARLSRASAPVRPGDRLVIRRGETLLRLEVGGMGERRGPASEAQGLYALLAADGPRVQGRD